jgi:maleylacetate reductase
MMMPQSILLDPSMTLATPVSLLLSTGIKAIDHAAERMTSAAANPFSDAVSALSLRLMSAALRRLSGEPAELSVRCDLQYGMFMSLAGSSAGVAVNVSHAIGHVLGAHAGVAHGDTSCVLLPAVLNWNSDVTPDAQAAIAQAMGRAGKSASAAVAELVADIGMVTRLRDTSVRRGDFELIADKTLHEMLLGNSRKPVSRADVIAILELAW